MKIGMQSNIRTTTLRAFSEDEMERKLKGMGLASQPKGWGQERSVW